MRKARANAEAEAETAERSKTWAKTKVREKVEIYRLAANAREKVDPEAEAAAMEEEKAIAAYMLAKEAGAETRVRVEAKADVRYRGVGILTDFLNKVKDASNDLNRAMVGSEKETKEKFESSRAEVEAEERSAKEEEEAILQYMIQDEVGYWESQ